MGSLPQRAKRWACPCPINRRLTVMIKEIEGEKRSIKVENLWDEALCGAVRHTVSA